MKHGNYARRITAIAEAALSLPPGDHHLHDTIMKFLKTALLALFLVSISKHGWAVQRQIVVHFQYPQIESLAGFRLYRENEEICSTDDPSATSLNCTIDIADGETWFTMTAVFSDGMESTPSSPLSYIFSSGLKALFTATPQQGELPLAVRFDASTSSGTIISYEWMFGDGESALGAVVNHTYTTAGTFNATLKVTDDTGAHDQEIVSLAITDPTAVNTPPMAVLSSSTGAGRAPLPVSFDGSGSTDSDGVIVSFGWDLGDGSTSFSPAIDHTYYTAGTFYAALTVTDDGGLSDSVSTPVLVQPPLSGNTPPTAVIKAVVKGNKFPLSVTFDGSKSSDADGTIKAYSWNFGDGAIGNGRKVEHTFIKPGQYTVSLKVTDNQGAVSSPVSYTIGTQAGETDLDYQRRRATQVVIDFLLLKPSPEDNSHEQPNDEQP